MSRNPQKPQKVIVVSGDDILRITTSYNKWQGKVECFNVILRNGLPKGIRISPEAAEEMLLAHMRGKRFEAATAVKWHWIGKETKMGRTVEKTYTNEGQLPEEIAERMLP